MSTENEGAAATPATQEAPTSPAVPDAGATDEKTTSPQPDMRKEPGPDAPPPPPYQPAQPGPSGQPGDTAQWGAFGSGPAGPGEPGEPGGPGGPYNPWAAPPVGPPPPPNGGRRRGGLIAGAVAVALVAGIVGGGIGFFAAERGESGTTTVSSSADPKELNRSPKSVSGIASKALPSVVTIKSGGSSEEGTGTGFVYDKQGHILTNNHVVAGAADGGKITATFSDGKKYEAEVLGKAQGYDIAVVKLKNADDRKLEPLPLGSSDSVQVGDRARWKRCSALTTTAQRSTRRSACSPA